MKLAHSYSAISQFKNCPKQYNEVRILKRFKSEGTEATRYGEQVHKAFEEFIRDKKPLPPHFEHYLPFVEPLANLQGETLCEVKMGIRDDFSPCDFFAKDVWFRGIPDVLNINHETGVARVGDWKTSKSSRYADTAQLELLAGMVMSHYPNVKRVKGALVFVVAGDVVKAEFTRDQYADIMSKWVGKADEIVRSLEVGVWNPRPGPLCKFCPVSDCVHHRS